MQIPISSLMQGHIMLNLGHVIEINELPECFEVIVCKMNQKMVLKFLKDDIVYIADET